MLLLTLPITNCTGQKYNKITSHGRILPSITLFADCVVEIRIFCTYCMPQDSQLSQLSAVVVAIDCWLIMAVLVFWQQQRRLDDEWWGRAPSDWETRKRLRFRPFKNLQKYKTVPFIRLLTLTTCVSWWYGSLWREYFEKTDCRDRWYWSLVWCSWG
jgi:hypothetical protein